MREAVARRCDGLFHIPQRGAVSSLNASVAAAIALYEAARQRRTSSDILFAASAPVRRFGGSRKSCHASQSPSSGPPASLVSSSSPRSRVTRMFEIRKLAASSRSAGKKYADAVKDDKGASKWFCSEPLVGRARRASSSRTRRR